MVNNAQRIPVYMREWLYSLSAPPIIRDIIDMIYRVFHNFSRHDGSHMAAGVAYYAVFSIFPLALATISIAGIILEANDVKQRVLEFLERNVGIGSEELVTSNIDALLDARGTIGFLAVVTLFWASRAVFGAVHRVMNRAWLVVEPPRFWVSQTAQLGSAIGIATLFILSATIGPVGRAIASQNETLFGVIVPWSALFTLLPLGISLVLFFFIYRFVPDANQRWRDAVPAAITATVLFEGAKYGFAFFLGNLSRLDVIYGSVTTVVVLMLFLYIVSIILVFGAELSSEYNRSTTSSVFAGRRHWRPVRGGLAPLHRPHVRHAILQDMTRRIARNKC
jgi:membrane protein